MKENYHIEERESDNKYVPVEETKEKTKELDTKKGTEEPKDILVINHWLVKVIITGKIPLVQALRKLFHIEGAKFFKKGPFQDCLKKHNLERSPG